MEAVELLTCAFCPLKCKYCYIPKSKKMKELHKEIKVKLKQQTYLENLEKIYGKNLKYLGLWGTEPSLTFNEILQIFPELIKKFPELKELSFSTSFLLPPKVYLNFFDGLERLNYPLKVKIQISCDGPSFITDKNRMRNAAKFIREHTLKLIPEVRKRNYRNLDLEFKWKATFSVENLKLLVENPSLVDSYWEYFKSQEEEIRPYLNSKVKFIFGSCSPTLVVPGKYTSEDGKIFAEFLKVWHSKGKLTSYSYRLRRLFKYWPEITRNPHAFTCSGGDSNFGVGDNLFLCHRTFYFDKDEYLESIFETDIENWDVSAFERGAINLIRDKFIVDPNDKKEIIRMKYVLRNYHDFWRFKLGYTNAMLIELARANQVDRIYLRAENLRNLFALFLNSSLSCPAENLINTGSFHLQLVSLMRMFGNGAFQELVRYELSRRE